MTRSTLLGLVLVALLGAAPVSAQQPGRQPDDTAGAGMRPSPHAGMEKMRGGMMSDSATARLDRLVQAMNQATGSKKTEAMAAVINELVAQRRAMHQHMQQMMGPGGMMDHPGRDDPHGHRMPGMTPRPSRDSSKAAPEAPDSGGHAEHHTP